MTVEEAFKIHRRAVRNVGKGNGYNAPGLDEALPVLNEFWSKHSSMYVTREQVTAYDAARRVTNADA